MVRERLKNVFRAFCIGSVAILGYKALEHFVGSFPFTV